MLSLLRSCTGGEGGPAPYRSRGSGLPATARNDVPSVLNRYFFISGVMHVYDVDARRHSKYVSLSMSIFGSRIIPVSIRGIESLIPWIVGHGMDILLTYIPIQSVSNR